MGLVDLRCSCGSGFSDYTERDGSPTAEQTKWLVGHVNADHDVQVPPWWSRLRFRIQVRGNC